MLYAMVAHKPAYGKTLKSFDDTETRKIAGVIDVVKVDNAVAVLATSTWIAKKGRDALKVEWEGDVSKLESTADHKKAFANLIQQKSPTPARNDGDVDKAFESPAKVLEAVYELPVLAHAPLEPSNFFADVKGDKVELYGPTQVPARMRTAVANALKIPEANITLGMPRQGGGFGRRLQVDNGLEAALISAAAKVPVQMIWTREDDMQNDYYRPSSMYKYRAALNSKNELDAWHLTAAALVGRGSLPDSFPAGSVPNFRSDSFNLPSNILTGAWRAPTSNAVAFSDECFLDEIAHAMGKDPIALRLELIERAKTNVVNKINYDPEKLSAVIKLVAETSGWNKPAPRGVFRGFACHLSFSSYAAHVAEVTLENGKPRVTKVYSAIHCGRVVNLSGAENQVEGAIIDGLSHALFSEVTFDKGSVVQTNFDTYEYARMKDTPIDIVVKFVPSDGPPTGLGEPGLPPIAPAVGNAIFAATGKRLRKLPFNL